MRDIMKTNFCMYLSIAVMCVSSVTPAAGGRETRIRSQLDACNVVWDSPSKNHNGSMPIGNGDIGLNVWVEEGGDLWFYISKTDSWSENGRLLKLGKVRVQLTPNPFEKARYFQQSLKLHDGEIEIQAGNESAPVTLRVWVDAHQPVIRVEAKGAKAFEMKAILEVWRREERRLKGNETNSARGLTAKKPDAYPIIVYPDRVLPVKGNSVTWYHRNEKSCYPVTLNNQHLGALLQKYPDPLLGRTFGARMKGTNLRAMDTETLQSIRPGKQYCLSIYPLTARTESAGDWLTRLKEQVDDIDATPLEKARQGHRQWWDSFWRRSWIHVSNSLIGQKITTNALPLRIGADSGGGNRFQGHIHRVSVFGQALTAAKIARLAADSEADISDGTAGDWVFNTVRENHYPDRSDNNLQARVVGEVKDTNYKEKKCVRLGGKGYLEVRHDKRLDFTDGCTLAAWIAPETFGEGGARIIDKAQSGTANGYLLDTYPGNSLRQIVAAQRLIHKVKLKAGEWAHVASTYDAGNGESVLYINGKPVAREKIKGDTFEVSRGYALQRWINACGGRGNYPIKFNGTIFTVDAQLRGKHFDADYRQWGGMYWWQNTRLPYWAMLRAGDFDLMEPLFRMYLKALPLCRDKTKMYYDHKGAFFPETMYFWGTNGNCDYGWGHPGPDPSNKFIRWEWQGGIEITAMMLDYYDMTEDREYLQKILLPLAREVITFYDQHWQRDENGTIRYEPSQALETWWKCVNPQPDVAGLHAVLPRLLELPGEIVGAKQRQEWQAMQKDLPPIPIRKKEGVSYLLPAESYAEVRNTENPEMYPVFPYRLFCLGQGELDIGLETWKRRRVKRSGGWRQDSIQAAYLGLTREAANYVVGNFSTWHTASRFPAFWGPNMDWIPDQCHGGVSMTALQSMLLQNAGRRIIILPAWPREWDVDFKLYANYNTTVEARVRDGEILKLTVTPKERKTDIVMGGDW